MFALKWLSQVCKELVCKLQTSIANKARAILPPKESRITLRGGGGGDEEEVEAEARLAVLPKEIESLDNSLSSGIRIG